VWRRYGGLVTPPRLIDRLRALDPRLIDALIALALAVLIVAQFVFGDQPGPEGDVVNLITGPLLALTLVWRRRAPLAMILALAALTMTNEALGGGIFSFPESRAEGVEPFASLLIAAVAFYSLGAHADERQATIGVVVGVISFWATVFISAQVDFGGFFFSTTLAVAPWLFGRVVRARRLRLVAAEREQEQRARIAVADERSRIARELHDIVAHSVGVIVVQAVGARRVFDRDPERAREALDSIERTARTALADMRRSLGVLRRDEDERALAPQPGVGDLSGLIEQARAGGLAVELAVEGERVPLPQAIDLSAYRIVQEALTNVIKHAGAARARVTIRYLDDELEVEVADDGAGPPVNAADESGLGIIGMRERVEAHGGNLHTGARTDGGFLVRASLPLGR
jgi:signal transduction histidine kinase